jgi:hypothetical protein
MSVDVSGPDKQSPDTLPATVLHEYSCAGQTNIQILHEALQAFDTIHP